MNILALFGLLLQKQHFKKSAHPIRSPGGKQKPCFTKAHLNPLSKNTCQRPGKGSVSAMVPMGTTLGTLCSQHYIAEISEGFCQGSSSKIPKKVYKSWDNSMD